LMHYTDVQMKAQVHALVDPGAGYIPLEKVVETLS